MSNPYYHTRDRDADAPEVAQVASPLTAVSNLEGEWQRQYQWTRDAERPPLPSGDTAKEAFNQDADAKYVVPLELKGEYPETATSITSPGTTTTAVPWTPDSERLQPVLSHGGFGSPGSLHGSVTGGPPPPMLPPGGSGATGGEFNENKDGKILGMSRKAFLILVVVIIIIVAAAVGGGVGGAVASKSKSDAAPVTTSSSLPTSSAPSPSTTSSAPTSTSATPSASPTPDVRFLNNETWPKGGVHAFQGFSRENFTGSSTEIFTEEGGHDFQFDLHSYVWVPNINNCCASLCANSTKQGWLGYRCELTKRLESSDPIARVFVWCSQNHTIEYARGKC
ncbi:hypothetical protein JDV02_006936 [Purpureocillium takamizusanense]|uniref:Uncharacterized protein n=1 Tax=Purpureocillium takamizusanense TaxID=2060973 RepID=A0A9Q8QLV4_9HYPO|nr:uncharacterized protein JDV02_006936 [Purpureocillium takamizusanense]UNI20887.1 hypothetical protein JDV02_006936 [Purpureocillium takamizusanense]